MYVEQLEIIVAEYEMMFPYVVLSIVIGVMVLCLYLIAYRRTASARTIIKALKGIDAKFVFNTSIENGDNRTIFIECLIAMSGGFLVIDIYNYKGIVFGSDNLDQWTHMVNHQILKFENPVERNCARVQAVKTHIRDVPVEGRIVFSNQSLFPRGIPRGVSMLDSLKIDIAHLANNNDTDKHLINLAWNQLNSHLRPI